MIFKSFVASRRTADFCEWCGYRRPQSYICPKCGKYTFNKTCPRCNKSYEANKVKDFCPDCGTAYSATTIKCKKCKNENDIKFKYCTGCGAKLK